MSKDYDQLMQYRMLQEINRKLSNRGWLSDFSSNIVGNAVWDGLLWMASRLIKKL